MIPILGASFLTSFCKDGYACIAYQLDKDTDKNPFPSSIEIDGEPYRFTYAGVLTFTSDINIPNKVYCAIYYNKCKPDIRTYEKIQSELKAIVGCLLFTSNLYYKV